MIKIFKDSLFELILKKNINEIGLLSLQSSFKTLDLIKCLSACSMDDSCVLIQYESFECNLFKVIQVQYIVDSEKGYLYKKKNNKLSFLNNFIKLIN